MNKKSKNIIYMNTNLQKQEFIYTGISFQEFITFLDDRIENILLLKSDYVGDELIKNFEAICGINNIKLFAEDRDNYRFGDFCFVDFKNKNNVYRMSDKELCQLLYIAHMHVPLTTPFF